LADAGTAPSMTMKKAQKGRSRFQDMSHLIGASIFEGFHFLILNWRQFFFVLGVPSR